MFTSYNNERNQHGGSDVSALLAARGQASNTTGIDLRPLGQNLNSSSLNAPEMPQRQREMPNPFEMERQMEMTNPFEMRQMERQMEMTDDSNNSNNLRPSEQNRNPFFEIDADKVIECDPFTIDYVMKDGYFYKINNLGFVESKATKIDSTILGISSSEMNSIEKLVDNCIKGVNTDVCIASLANITRNVTILKALLTAQNQNGILVLADILIKKYNFKTIPNPTVARIDGRDVILESFNDWSSRIEEPFKSSIQKNRSLKELLQCIVEGINQNEKFLNPHKVKRDPNDQFRDSPYEGPNKWLWTPTQRIDYKERCYKLVKRCENLFTTDLGSYKSAVLTYITKKGPYSPFYVGGSDQIGGTASFIDMQKIRNQLKDASPWFKQLFEAFKNYLATKNQTIDPRDVLKFEDLIKQYEKTQKDLTSKVGIMVNAINETTGNERVTTFDKLKEVSDEQVSKKFADCEKTMGAMFGGLHTLIGYM